MLDQRDKVENYLIENNLLNENEVMSIFAFREFQAMVIIAPLLQERSSDVPFIK